MDARHLNIKIWEETFGICESGLFKDIEVKSSIKHNFVELDALLENINAVPIQDNDTVITVPNEDTFTMAHELVTHGLNPLVLNMASDYHPGGGVSTGALAQEENLFRRSNYYKFLPKKEFYPIEKDELIYSPNVFVFRDKHYDALAKPFQVGCIACAGIRNPLMTWTIEKDPKLVFSNQTDIELTKKKLRAIFQVALLYGHDSLVLGALGCGAFHNPPYEIARLFKEILTEFSYHFAHICFAVYSVKDKNHSIFKEVLLNSN